MSINRRRVALGLVLLSSLKDVQERKRRKRWWVKTHLARRCELGMEENLLADLLTSDGEDYRNFLRMSHEKFLVLHEKIAHKIQRSDTCMRQAISSKVRLAICLRFLATGDSFRSLEFLSRVSRSTIACLVPEVCAEIYSALREEFKIPDNHNSWRELAENFNNIWQFPHAVGALDGKHILIKAPQGEGSRFFNYKGTHSVVLLALVDASYHFIYVDVGCNGLMSDGGVYKNSTLYPLLNGGQSLPPPEKLPHRDFSFPYFILGDDAFQLDTTLMKPFPRTCTMSTRHKVFNYRLSRARRVVENAFGILANRFRIYLRPIEVCLPTIDKLILCSCALHNYLLADSPPNSLNVGDSEVAALPSVQERQGANYSSTHARLVRENLADYFMSEGEVDFQWNCVV
ncbi:putative nuclease HARBI1 [Ischnura elegans]|uniref:putative nuclease HARBI1 n=1 Tax=Ischnura elegans TaxID=197161 RepID=UPI001ED86809|nr:putative nuclease HARBI1 [Ischnura elegans]